ncbi:MAG: hypothetical protein IPK37_15445 [Austwickia sp.]|nr:MAG: hypothetical protein IPK37_15445 [Austwickia sp.]
MPELVGDDDLRSDVAVAELPESRQDPVTHQQLVGKTPDRGRIAGVGRDGEGVEREQGVVAVAELRLVQRPGEQRGQLLRLAVREPELRRQHPRHPRLVQRGGAVEGDELDV